MGRRGYRPRPTASRRPPRGRGRGYPGDVQPFIALTDGDWYRFLRQRAGPDGRLDEVNFWSPRTDRPLARLSPGEPVFLRLKSPLCAIAGYGFFAHFTVVRVGEAWRLFGEKNGDPDEASFLTRIGRYRKRPLTGAQGRLESLACTILRDVRFWPQQRWIPWDAAEGWARHIVRGKRETDPARASRLLAEIRFDHGEGESLVLPPEFSEAFQPLEIDERRWRETMRVAREGQGAFRLRLLDAYGRRCAITGEHTEVVLDAAHVQPYLGPASNHVQNGLVMTKEFHALFDEGYVTVTPEHEVLVSTRLRKDYSNGHRYYPYDGRRLSALPERVEERPSPEALEWHRRHVFLD